MLANQNQNKQKQNNKANIKTRERKENNKLSNELQATCTNYSVKDTLSLQDTRGSIKWLQNLLFHHVLIIKLQAIKDKQTNTGIFESRFLQTKIQERERERRHFNSFSQWNFLVSPNSSTNCDYPFHHTVVLINKRGMYLHKHLVCNYLVNA